jgi:hypothetical protein
MVLSRGTAHPAFFSNSFLILFVNILFKFKLVKKGLSGFSKAFKSMISLVSFKLSLPYFSIQAFYSILSSLSPTYFFMNSSALALDGPELSFLRRGLGYWGALPPAEPNLCRMEEHSLISAVKELAFFWNYALIFLVRSTL